jgi:hypothetical protein
MRSKAALSIFSVSGFMAISGLGEGTTVASPRVGVLKDR